MPIYEFKCLKCGFIFERMMKVNDESPKCMLAIKTNHPKVLERCDGETKRLISKSTFHLKGEGWYKDGYSKKNLKKISKNDKKAE